MNATTIDIDKIVEVLNRAYWADPIAMWQMRCFMVPVNAKLAVEDPSIECGSAPMSALGRDEEDGPIYTLRFIGLINGFLEGTGKAIAERWEEVGDDSKRIFYGYAVIDHPGRAAEPEPKPVKKRQPGHHLDAVHDAEDFG